MDNQEFIIYIDDQHYSCDQLVSPDIAAKLLGVSRRTLRRMTAQRSIPVYRYNQQTHRYLISDLIDYLDEYRLEAVP